MRISFGLLRDGPVSVGVGVDVNGTGNRGRALRRSWDTGKSDVQGGEEANLSPFVLPERLSLGGLKVGADKVVFPENESGTRLAKNLLSSGFVDVFDLSGDVSMIELNVKPEWVGKTLVELNLRKKLGVNVIAIRSGENLDINIDPFMQLEASMQMLVIVNTSKINKLKD